MAPTATSCTACGFEFPRSAETPKSKGWEYSDFAEVSLIVGAFCSVSAAIVLAYIAIIGVITKHYQPALLSLLQAVISFAMCVVFLRVRK